MKVSHKSDYAKKRRTEYPPIGDQLDAIWKYIAQVPGQKPPEVESLLSRIEAVKLKYPRGAP